MLTRRSATVSEGLALGHYVAAGVGFEPTTNRSQGTELTTEPQPPIYSSTCTSSYFSLPPSIPPQPLLLLFHFPFLLHLIFHLILLCISSHLIPQTPFPQTLTVRRSRMVTRFVRPLQSRLSLQYPYSRMRTRVRQQCIMHTDRQTDRLR